jgi:hypothetical protein
MGTLNAGEVPRSLPPRRVQFFGVWKLWQGQTTGLFTLGADNQYWVAKCTEAVSVIEKPLRRRNGGLVHGE